MSDALVGAFADLFSGLDEAYGTGAGRWIHEPVTTALYEAHLAGRGEGLGIAPLRRDGTVTFASVDLDEPDFETAGRIALMLPGPSFVERSRSGNAHIHVFFSDPIKAWVPRGIMRSVLEALGLSRVEVFPKQDALADGMLGNYINLPYFGDSRPILTSFAYRDEEYLQERSLEDFITEASTFRNAPAPWERVVKVLGVLPPELRAAPREREFGASPHLHICAAHILEGARSGERPVVAGHRAVVYFSLAKQLLDWEGMEPEQAWELVEEVNDLSPDPAPEADLRRIFNNAASGRYLSTGCDDPLMEPYVHPDCPIAR